MENNMNFGLDEKLKEILVNLGPWGGISRELHVENKVIEKLIFTNYEELKEILEIAFNIYEDFKKDAIKNIDKIE